MVGSGAQKVKLFQDNALVLFWGVQKLDRFLSCFAYKFDFATTSSKGSFAMTLLHKSNALFATRSGKVSDKLEVGVVGISLENIRALCQHG